jgi:hypothetical protein
MAALKKTILPGAGFTAAGADYTTIYYKIFFVKRFLQKM